MLKWVTSLLAFTLLSACQARDLPAEQVVFGPSIEPPRSETPVPPCVSLPDVKLDVVLLSENSVQIKITGLAPNEPVHIIFSSQAGSSGKKIEYGQGQHANGEGLYESSQPLRAPNLEGQFTDWEVRVIHSGVSTCSRFVLPKQ